MNEGIELICGCVISHEPEHGPGCKCGESFCQTGYWHMESSCDLHAALEEE